MKEWTLANRLRLALLGPSSPRRKPGDRRFGAPAAVLPAAVLACLLLGAGCQGPAAPGPAPAATANPHKAAPPDVDDACADQLHDLIGDLLMYYTAHGSLPDSLEDLHRAGPGPSLALACPTSRTPYIYDPEGIPIPGLPGRLIVYDATPCHKGQRWGILAERPRPGKPLFFRVIHPPESIFPHK